MIALMAANNETGVLQPWSELAELCLSHGIPMVCDAAQWVGKLPSGGLSHCDFVAGCAHKFGGPPGVGFLKASQSLSPLICGGPQEDGQRAGTENVPGVLAMMAALEERESLAQSDVTERVEVRNKFERTLAKDLIGIAVVAEGTERLWNTVSVLMPEIADCRRRWVVKLDKLGFAVSTGSACSSGKEAPSHVLSAMGYTPAEASRVLRVSAGWGTRPEDWEALRHGLVRAEAEMRLNPAPA